MFYIVKFAILYCFVIIILKLLIMVSLKKITKKTKCHNLIALCYHYFRTHFEDLLRSKRFIQFVTFINLVIRLKTGHIMLTTAGLLLRIRLKDRYILPALAVRSSSTSVKKSCFETPPPTPKLASE